MIVIQISDNTNGISLICSAGRVVFMERLPFLACHFLDATLVGAIYLFLNTTK